MNAAHIHRQLARLGCTLLMATAAAGHAESLRKVQSVPQPPAPANAATFGLPKPAGLTSQFPAGLPETGVTNNAGTTGTTSNNGTPATSATVEGANAAPGVAYMGAAAPQGPVSGPAGSYTPLQIAQSFLGADANHDGDLTRAEFQHLTIKPYTFEEMDADHDGIVTRSEYENAVR